MISTYLLITICLYHIRQIIADLPLNNYELIEYNKRIYKRSIDDYFHDFEFKAFNKTFNVVLHRQKNLFSENFHAKIIKDDGNNPLSIDQTIYYEGYLRGQSATTECIFHFEQGFIEGSIQTLDEKYYIERADNHLDEPNKLLVYRASDLKTKQSIGPKCKTLFGQKIEENTQRTSRSFANRRRNRRATGIQGFDTCAVALVADYKFFVENGHSDVSSTVSYMVGVISRVNSLYRGEDFGDGYLGIGFEIRSIYVHTSETIVTAGQTHYNMANAAFDSSAFLEAFAIGGDWSNICLAHLFTATSFDGVLGMGYIASPTAGYAGGICSPGYGPTYYNTAFTTTLSSGNRRILSQEADLVTAHEFGHNHGSVHDDDTCSPSSRDGGKYLMYPYSVSGDDPNNNNFSPCSKVSINSVLKSKITDCFTARSESFCGNSNVEKGEQCDGGSPMMKGTDPCCDTKCQFTSGSICSDTNSLCCTNCAYSSNTTVCRQTSKLTTSCQQDATCNGTSDACPDSLPKPNGQSCIENGTCSNGQCLSFCESQGLLSCKCEAVAESCQWCCKNSTTDICSPILGASMPLPDGKTCVQGYCQTGVCIKKYTNTADRIWTVITNLSVSNILKFFKDNLVLATIILSLILYIPMCIVVACIDWRYDDEDKKEIEWHRADNNNLVLPGKKANIYQTYKRKRPAQTSFYNRGAVAPMD